MDGESAESFVLCGFRGNSGKNRRLPLNIRLQKVQDGVTIGCASIHKWESPLLPPFQLEWRFFHRFRLNRSSMVLVLLGNASKYGRSNWNEKNKSHSHQKWRQLASVFMGIGKNPIVPIGMPTKESSSIRSERYFKTHASYRACPERKCRADQAEWAGYPCLGRKSGPPPEKADRLRKEGRGAKK